jgi:hypothetical protein
LPGPACPDNSDIHVHFVRPSLAGQFGHQCPVCPAKPGRTIRTSMSSLPGEARPDNSDINVHFVRPSLA